MLLIDTDRRPGILTKQCFDSTLSFQEIRKPGGGSGLAEAMAHWPPDWLQSQHQSVQWMVRGNLPS